MKKISLYAKAFLEANPSNEDMLWIGALDDKKVRKKIQNIFNGREINKEKIINLELPHKSANFLKLLKTEKVLDKLDKIVEKIKKLAPKYNFEFAEIEFADDNSQKNLDSITESLEKKLKSKVILKTGIDKRLIAGTKIRTSKQTIDLSLQQSIKHFSKHLTTKE